MNEWLEVDRTQFLAEFLRLDGRGPSRNQSCTCGQPMRVDYRCIDCFLGCLVCQPCMIKRHTGSPLHHIEVRTYPNYAWFTHNVWQRWNGSFFEKISLRKLGLRIQLNHPISERCINPQQATGDDFIIIDAYAIHEVGLDFCRCERSISSSIQLLRARLYPATGTNPRSAATFNCLKQFHLLSFESKCSGYEYYSSVTRGTDNIGLIKPRVRHFHDFYRAT